MTAPSTTADAHDEPTSCAPDSDSRCYGRWEVAAPGEEVQYQFFRKTRGGVRFVGRVEESDLTSLFLYAKSLGMTTREALAFFPNDPSYLARGGRSHGSHGDEVVKLQQGLAAAGCYAEPVTGLFDKATERAVKCFQRQARLPRTGVATKSTLERLHGRATCPSYYTPDDAYAFNASLYGASCYWLDSLASTIEYSVGVSKRKFRSGFFSCTRTFLEGPNELGYTARFVCTTNAVTMVWSYARGE